MSRIKILFAAAFAVLALLTVTSVAGAAPPSCTVTGTTVNCTGTLTGLPPGITHVALTVAYACVYVFHPEVVASRGTSTEGADVTSDNHGNATFNLTASAPTCHGGTVPVPQSATLTLSQSGVVFLIIGPIAL
jgi:hypothetical protein